MSDVLLSADFLVSVVLVALLSSVIVMAWRLNKRLETIRDSSGELNALIKDLNTSAERAYQAVAQLRAAAKEHQGGLEKSISKARDLSDELSVITQSADSLANRLTGGASAPVKQTSAAGLPAAGGALEELGDPVPRRSNPVQPLQADAAVPTENAAPNPRDELRRILAGVR